MSDPLVTLQILNWNGEAVLERCINSLLRQSYKNFEILVVDNASTDNSINLLKKYSEIILICNQNNVGYAAGNNIGFSQAHGKYVAALNNDVFPEPDWLQRVIPLLENDPAVGIVSSRQMNYFRQQIIDGLFQVVTRSLNFYHIGFGREYNDDKPLFPNKVYVAGASGASAVYRKTMLNELGGFDELFCAYFEDSDLNLRAFWNGWKCVYEPNAVVYHMGSHSFGFRTPLYIYYLERNRYWFMIKNYPVTTLLLRIPFIILSEVNIIRIYSANAEMFKAYAKGRKDGLAGLMKILRKRRKRFDPLLKRKLANLAKHKIIPC